MKGDRKIIDILNDVLTAELTAINQYFVHGEMCDNWGYDRLHHVIRQHSIESGNNSISFSLTSFRTPIESRRRFLTVWRATSQETTFQVKPRSSEIRSNRFTGSAAPIRKRIDVSLTISRRVAVENFW